MPLLLKIKKKFLVVLILNAIMIPFFWFDFNGGRAYADQVKFHYPTIKHFESTFNFDNYPSATTPGYHLILATVGRYISDHVMLLRIVNSLFTTALFLMIGSMLEGKFSFLHLVLLIMPAMTSIYMIPSGLWLVPDNLAWLTVLLGLLAVSQSGKNGFSNKDSLVFATSVLIRQNNVWLAGPHLYKSLTLSCERGTVKVSEFVMRSLTVVPSFLFLGYFFYRWNGPVPPMMANKHMDLNPAAPCFFFALFFVYSLFYFPLLTHLIIKRFHGRRVHLKNITLFLATCFLLSLIPRTDFNIVEGRSSGLWNVVKHFPSIHHRSLLIMIAAPLGAVSCWIWIYFVEGAMKSSLITSIICFAVMQISSHYAFERYYAGFIFILLFIFIKFIPGINSRESTRAGFVGVLLFALLNSFVLYRGLT